MCCSRRGSGRANISYRSYKPLSAEESQHGEAEDNKLKRGGANKNRNDQIGAGDDGMGNELIDENKRLDMSDLELERSYAQNTTVLQKLRLSLWGSS